MDIESILKRELIRYVPEPSFWQAINCLEVYTIQNAAMRVAALKRDEALELNSLRRATPNMSPLNYRDFIVTSVAIGIIPLRGSGGRFAWHVAASYNTKPHPNVPKMCAERRNGRKLLRRSCCCCVGVGTMGEMNIRGDDRSGMHGPRGTLDMCECCRDDAVDEFSDLYCEEALFINENPATGARTEARTLSQIFAHHNENWPGLRSGFECSFRRQVA